MSKPLAIDLFCGLFGWSEGLVAEGFEVFGFDIEDMCGQFGYPRPPHCHLALQNVLTLHGSQFKDAALIVASPPCQEYSYMAMPWSKAKEKAAPIRADTTGAEMERLTRLFRACFRIQREACEAAGRHVPMVVENVRGAIPWVGRSRWNFGSFHLWADVPALMPTARAIKTPGRSLDKAAVAKWGTHNMGSAAPMLREISENQDGQKVPGFRFDGSGKSFQTASVEREGVKVGGMNWSDRSQPTKGFNVTAAQRYREGSKGGGDWFGAGDNCSPQRRHGSKSNSRKAASAMIAKIPLALSRHIASVYRP